MSDQPNTPKLTGRKVFVIVASFFTVIIAVNLTLAYNAVSTFPGLEVKNSYIASQSFDERRAAQQGLGWTIDASVDAGILALSITEEDGSPAQLQTLDATLGRATHVQDDMTPEFVLHRGVYTAPVDLAPGNWNLRMRAVAEDGTEFTQRVVLRIEG